MNRVTVETTGLGYVSVVVQAIGRYESTRRIILSPTEAELLLHALERELAQKTRS